MLGKASTDAERVYDALRRASDLAGDIVNEIITRKENAEGSDNENRQV